MCFSYTEISDNIPVGIILFIVVLVIMLLVAAIVIAALLYQRWKKNKSNQSYQKELRFSLLNKKAECST